MTKQRHSYVLETPAVDWEQYIQDNQLQFVVEMDNSAALERISTIQLNHFFGYVNDETHPIQNAEFLIELDGVPYLIRFKASLPDTYEMKRTDIPEIMTPSLHALSQETGATTEELHNVLYGFALSTLPDTTNKGAGQLI